MLMSTATFGTLCGFFDGQFFKIVIESGNWYRVKAELSAALSLSRSLSLVIYNSRRLIDGIAAKSVTFGSAQK